MNYDKNYYPFFKKSIEILTVKISNPEEKI